MTKEKLSLTLDESVRMILSLPIEKQREILLELKRKAPEDFEQAYKEYLRNPEFYKAQALKRLATKATFN